MRLPATKVYRAFPELDRFTDAQCQEYVRQVRRRFRGQRRVFGTLVNIGTLFLLLGMFAGLLIVFIVNNEWTTLGKAMLDHPALGALVIGAGTAGPPLLLRYALNHAWLRRRIRMHMLEIRCVQCRYLLLGTLVRDGAVTCPECGERVVLESLGLTAEDVMGATPHPGAAR